MMDALHRWPAPPSAAPCKGTYSPSYRPVRFEDVETAEEPA